MTGINLQTASINWLRNEIERKINFTNESSGVHYKEVELKEIQTLSVRIASFLLRTRRHLEQPPLAGWQGRWKRELQDGHWRREGRGEGEGEIEGRRERGIEGEEEMVKK